MPLCEAPLLCIHKKEVFFCIIVLFLVYSADTLERGVELGYVKNYYVCLFFVTVKWGSIWNTVIKSTRNLVAAAGWNGVQPASPTLDGRATRKNYVGGERWELLQNVVWPLLMAFQAQMFEYLTQNTFSFKKDKREE